MMKFEEVAALNIKKGDRVRFSNNGIGQPKEGVVLTKKIKTVSGGKYFNASYGRWMSAEPVKRIYLTIQEDGKSYTTGEDNFKLLEVVK